jgi:hypothetical protein
MIQLSNTLFQLMTFSLGCMRHACGKGLGGSENFGIDLSVLNYDPLGTINELAKRRTSDLSDANIG